ncbi:hypothetical protein AKJ16_DCAP15352 [Drosera capensis]
MVAELFLQDTFGRFVNLETCSATVGSVSQQPLPPWIKNSALAVSTRFSQFYPTQTMPVKNLSSPTSDRAQRLAQTHPPAAEPP